MSFTKSQVSCSVCSKVSKKSVLLPCGDCSCEDHLHETIGVDQNKIKCQVCYREFFIGDSRIIMPNKTLQHLIEMTWCHSNLKEKQIPRLMEERVSKEQGEEDEIVEIARGGGGGALVLGIVGF